MSWKCFDLTFSIKSPIHIGYRKIGLLQRTRYYIPGKNLWAALTAKMTSVLRNSPSGSDYKNIGNFIRENMIFSYFYLQKDKKSYLPEFIKGKGLVYGNLLQDEFERRFITSIPSTAIDHEIGSAEYGSLHEIEVITGGDKEDKKPVDLGGHLFVREQENLASSDNDIIFESESIVRVLGDGIFVGGERSYGFGKICLEKIQKAKNSEYELENEVFIKLGKGDHIRAHLEVAKNVRLKGEIEAFSGREWGDEGSGRKKSKPLAAWVPGSIAIDDYRLKVTEFGILRNSL